MAIKVTIDGGIILDEHVCKTADFIADTPDDSNARSTDLSNTLKITGKILTILDGGNEVTIELAKWANKRAEDEQCYKSLELEVISAAKVVRRINFTKAFVVDYVEHFGDMEGVGEFTLICRQKKDKILEVDISGGH